MRGLHECGRNVEVFGRPLPVVLYNMFDPDGMFSLTRAANPTDLVEEFLAADPDWPSGENTASVGLQVMLRPRVLLPRRGMRSALL